MNNKTFRIYTLGCRVNQYESGAAAKLMETAGFVKAREGTTEDISIINSCTVTENSDKKALKLVRQLKSRGCTVVLSGCYPQAFPEQAAESGADIVTGNAQRVKIPELVRDYYENKNFICNVYQHNNIFEELPFSDETDKTRAYLKIEDGCDRFCSYCAIPYARGRVRSRTLESITEEAGFLAAAGHKELVLTGINLSCYGKDIGLELADAVSALQNIPQIKRIRLSSMEPEMLDPENINRLKKCAKLCPHFHLSLQSGCDRTLKAMNRHYSGAEYAETAANLRSAFNNCALTTDIMVGFAGETDSDFLESMEFAKNIGFAKIHVFTFSARPGTAAEKMKNQIPDDVKAERYKKMSELADSLRSKFFQSQLNLRHTVLIEKRTSPDYLFGHTENFTPVRIYNCSAQRHDLLPVIITAAYDDYCIGKIV